MQLSFLISFLFESAILVQAVYTTEEYDDEIPIDVSNESPPCGLNLHDPSMEFTCFSYDEDLIRPCSSIEPLATYVQASCRPPYFYNESHPTHTADLICLIDGVWGEKLKVSTFKCRPAHEYLYGLEQYKLAVSSQVNGLQNESYPDKENIFQSLNIYKDFSSSKCQQPLIYFGRILAWTFGKWILPKRMSYQRIAYKIQCHYGYALPRNTPSVYYCAKGFWSSELKADSCKRTCSLESLMAENPNTRFDCFDEDMTARLCHKNELVGTVMRPTCRKGYHFKSTRQTRSSTCMVTYREWLPEIKNIDCVKY